MSPTFAGNARSSSRGQRIGDLMQLTLALQMPCHSQIIPAVSMSPKRSSYRLLFDTYRPGLVERSRTVIETLGWRGDF